MSEPTTRALLAAVLLGATARAEGLPTAPQNADAEDEAEPAPTFGGQIHVRYEKTDPGPTEGELSLARAKVEVQWQPKKRIEGVLAVDVSPAVDAGGTVAPLDAYLQVEAWKWLRVRAGHRKIPFSGLRLQSLSNLIPITRGEYGQQLDQVFGDLGGADLAREVGVDLRLRAKPLRTRVDCGVSQGEKGPKDWAARITIRPADALDLGAAVAAIHIDEATGEQRRVVGELDAEIHAGGWHAEAEGAAGDADDTEGDDGFAAAYVLLAYRFALDGEKKTPALEPFARFDFVDQKMRVKDDEAFAVTGGVNVYPRNYLRLMLDVERIERRDNYRERPAPDETRLLVQLAFDV